MTTVLSVTDAAVPTVLGNEDPLLRFVDVDKSYRLGGLGDVRRVRAVDGVTLDVERGEALGLIGQSGSGKSTLARLALGLVHPERGQILFEGRDLAKSSERNLRAIRRSMHLIFQDPYDSLSPRMRTADVVAEPMVIHRMPRKGRGSRVLEALEEADLRPAAEFARRYPHELSGGQRQRVALARALVLRPRLVIADEPTSMLDVSLRAGLLRTMQSLRERHGITFLFITHDLALARHFCDRLAVLLHGKIVELGPSEEIVGAARHPYTQALMQAVRELKPPAPAIGLPASASIRSSPGTRS